MNFQEFKQAVIEQAEKMGIAQYELYYQTAESTTVEVFKQEVKAFTSSTEGGVCFRCVVDGKMGYASTEELSAQRAASVVAKAVDNARTLETEEEVFLGQAGQVYEQLETVPYELPSTEELLSGAMETQKKLYACNAAVIDGSETETLAERNSIAIYNSNGLDLSYENTLSGYVAMALVSDGKDVADDFNFKLGNFHEIDTDALTKKTVDSAMQQLGGDVAPTGAYPVVFNPDAMCSLLSTFSGIFSSEAAQKGLSKFADKEGSTVASAIVTLTDDPFHPQSHSKRTFDAEGSPARRKNLIENGELKTLLYNLKTAAVAGKTTTGNASKAGYDSPIGVQPFTLCLQPGDMSEAELLEQVGEGVYITSLGGLHAGANPITGDFSLQSSGFMIEGGKKTTFVKSFTVAGNYYDLLKNITAVASNLELPGMARFGSPSVRVDGLSIAGK